MFYRHGVKLVRVLVLAAMLQSAHAAERLRAITLIPTPLAGGYAVVVSEQTYTNSEWRAVVQTLLTKYQGTRLIKHSGGVENAREALIKFKPRYTAFVAQPEEAGRDYVAAVHRLTRELDDDPYPDTMWGILTGYSAHDVFRMVTNKTPLVIRKGAGGTAIPLDAFEEGVWYDEGKQGRKVVKLAGGQPQEQAAPADATEELVAVFNQFKPDFFMTSGHATERDWQIGYAYKSGQFVCKDGVLYGKDTRRKTYRIDSPNPKIYLPAGNCLMGHIQDRQSMALAFMGSGGVNQMIGYTVVTWYGYGGWGVRDYFFGTPGRLTFAEAFYCNQIALNHELVSRFPATVGARFPSYEFEKDPQLLNRFAAQIGLRDRATAKDNLGLLWDRDVVAFYGDPAWEARLKAQPPEWVQVFNEKKGVFTFEVIARPDAANSKPVAPSRPVIQLFPFRLKNIKVLEGAEYQPVIMENFLLLGQPRQLERGKSYRVVFQAQKD